MRTPWRRCACIGCGDGVDAIGDMPARLRRERGCREEVRGGTTPKIERSEKNGHKHRADSCLIKCLIFSWGNENSRETFSPFFPIFPHFSPFFPTIKSRLHQKICHIQVLTHLALTSRPLERHVSTDIATFRCGRPQTVTSMYPEALPTSARPANTFLEALAQDFHRQQLAFIISSVIH